MSRKVDQFDRQSPQKVYNTAKVFSKTFSVLQQVPTSPIKKSQLQELKDYNKASIRFAIDQSKYQNHLFKRLQKADKQKRTSFDKKIKQKDEVVEKNIISLAEKQDKEIQKINKHQKQVFKAHVELEKTKKHDKDDEAVKLRKQLLHFYKQQKERKRINDACQIKVPTCYRDAVNRLDRIHQQNQEYSKKSQKEYLKRMARNSHRDRYVLERSRAQSAENAKKQQIYDYHDELLEDKQKKYIQVIGKDFDGSIKAFDHKDAEVKKEKERINKFFKERVQKWSEIKRRVKIQRQTIPDKCLSILDKTTKASFRKTVSSFKDSGREWHNRVQMNKSAIYERDEMDKDRIMKNHLDMRFRNSASFKINEKMGTMRNQAKKLANEYA